MKIEIEREDDGRWLAEVPELPGVMVYGASREEAISNAKSLAERVLAGQLEPDEDNLLPQSHPDPILESIISFILVTLFWTTCAFCFRVDAIFPEDSRVGIVMVIALPWLFLGIGYGLSAFNKWRVLYEGSRRSSVPQWLWLELILVLPSILSCLVIAGYFLFSIFYTSFKVMMKVE